MNHPHLFFHILVRWIDFVALVAVVGGLVYCNLLSIPLPRDLPAPKRSPRSLIMALLLLLGITSIADLILRTLMMNRLPVFSLFSVLPTVLTKTHFGAIWTWRAGLLIFLFSFLWSLKNSGSSWTGGHKTILLAAAAGICLTTSLSGHAASRGNLTLTVFLDGVHLMAVSIWVGGLFTLQILLPGSLDLLDKEGQREYLTRSIERFSTAAVTSVALLTATGFYNTWVHVHSLSLLVGTSYGKILIVKWSLLLLMLVLGGVSRFGILPLLWASAGKRKGLLIRKMMGGMTILRDSSFIDLERWFFRLVMIEAILGLGVLACSAWITQIPPPHHNLAVMGDSRLKRIL